MKTLLIRVDGDSRIGTGHVMRCLALAQAWHRGGGVAVFCSISLSDGLARLLAAGGFEVVRPLEVDPGSVEDAHAVVELIKSRSATALACDNYHFRHAFQEVVAKAGARFLVIADYPIGEPFVCDLLLNQNLGSARGDYPHLADSTQALLGPSFALLRQEFFERRQNLRAAVAQPAEGGERRVLITFGGADPVNATGAAIRVLGRVAAQRGLRIKAVVGSANPHRADLQAAALEFERVELLFDVTDMPALMEWSELAVSAGGSTVWEFCLFGIPTVLYSIAPNQDGVVKAMGAIGAAIDLGVIGELDEAALAATVGTLLKDREAVLKMSVKARELVDGIGADRVATALNGSDIVLRPATPDDCRLYFTWANSPEVRSRSLDSDPIPWKTHERWFEVRMNSPDSYLFVAESVEDTKPVGQIRYERGDDCVWVVSLSVTSDARGRGVGKELMCQGAQRLAQSEGRDVEVSGTVKMGNQASLHLFRKLGFEENNADELAIFRSNAASIGGHLP